MALGCENHTVSIFDRGGVRRIDVLPEVLSVEYERVRDDISVATAVVNNPSPECGRLLDSLSTGRHELVVHRGNDRVWEGPLTHLSFTRNTVTLGAKDIGHYVYRTWCEQAYDNAHPNVTTCIQRALNMLFTELQRKEACTPAYNVLPHVRAFRTPDDSRTSRKTLPFQTTVFEQIDDMAAKSGMDYTVVGRSLILFDTHTVIGVTPQMTENDFQGDIIVAEYGMDLTTREAVTDGQGGYAVSGVLEDPFYGNWEVLHTAYSEEGTTAPSASELQSQANRNISGRNPAPVIVRVPDGATLNPAGAWDINQLIPGVRIPLVATLTARRVSQMQKLDLLKVTDGPDGEKVMVTLSPASADDTPAVEDGDPGSEVH